MKLLDVKAVLDREKDIQKTDPKRDILKELDDQDTCYAILSHRWGAEVSYKEMIGLMKMGEEVRNEVRQRYGYKKIIKSCEQAEKDRYKWLWIDTCCIDKRSSSELSEAINSMYRWYQNAQICYAYLNDVDEPVFPVKRDGNKFGKSNGWPEWFVRGWTLQELIAPKEVEFFNKDWVSIGNKRDLAPVLKEITTIPPEVVRDGLVGKRLSVAQIMSWAAERETTRVEDRAYSLMGLFGVNMPMLYGEGKKAFRRLQLEIIREFSDHSIFAWGSRSPRTGSILADDPSDFWDCGDIRKVEPDEFAEYLVGHAIENNLGHNPWYIGGNSIENSLNPIHWCGLAWLFWRGRSLSQPLRTFSVSNAGIQVCLPVIPHHNSPHLRALLACRRPREYLVTIDLVFSGSSFDRTSTVTNTTNIRTTYPEFRTLYLTHNQDANEKRRELRLDDKHVSYHGFTRRGTFPRKFTGDTVTLSLTDDLIVIVYANDDVKSRFAVGLGYYLGQGWVHVASDGRPPTQEADWIDFTQNAYDQMWKARAKYASSMPQQKDSDYFPRGDHFIKHAHLPRSIWGAKVFWGRWEMDDFKVMIDVEQCPGCCDGPCGWSTTHNTGNHSIEPGNLTPLDTTTSPQVWQRGSFFKQRRKQFQSIREHFCSLVNMDQSRGPEARHKSVNRQKADRTIKCFSDMFGLPRLSNYVGNITFFERLPSMMEASPDSEISVGNVEVHGLPARPPKGMRQSNAVQDPRLEVALPLLRERCRNLCAKHVAPRQYADEKQKVARELKSISQTLSAGLLKHIGITFKEVWIERRSLGIGPSSGIEYDRHFNTRSVVKEVEALQTKLSATKDEDEQRALEEDVTGKVLWLCWCGICEEVDELLPKVVDYIRREGRSWEVESHGQSRERQHHQQGLPEIESAMSSLTDPDDDLGHLQRIMFDAGAGTSKHQLLLDARAAEKAKWSGTTISRNTPNTNTQGPSTSS